MMRPPKGLPQAYYDKKHRRKLAEKFLCAMLNSNIGVDDKYVKELTEISLKFADEMMKQTDY